MSCSSRNPVVAWMLLVASGVAVAQSQCNLPAAFRSRSETAESYGKAAHWFSDHGQTACAVRFLHNGIDLQPSNAVLHYDLGSVLYRSGHSKDAVLEWQQAIKMNPNFLQAHMALGVLLHNTGDRDGALQQWQEVLKLDPTSNVALDWVAKARIEAEQYTSAIDLLRGAPDTEDLAMDRTLAEAKASLTEDALGYGKRELKLHPKWVHLSALLASILVQRNRYEEALTLLRPALYAERPPVDLEILYLRTLVLMEKTDEALPYATERLREHPDEFDFLYLTGLLERQSADYPAALQNLERAAQMKPDHFDVRFNLGIVLAKMRRPAEARVELLQAENLPGASPDVHFQLAIVLRQLGDAQGATAETRIYQQELAKRSQRDEMVSLSAQASQKLEAGDATTAAKLDRDILAKDPNDATQWYNLALALDRLGDTSGKTEALEHAVTVRPGFALAWNELGYVQMRSGKNSEAEAAFRRAVALAPQYAEAENNLGSLLVEEGRGADAEQHFRAALAANPRYVDAWINLAASLAESTRYGDARQAAESALKVDPQNSAATQLLHMLPEISQPGSRP